MAFQSQSGRFFTLKLALLRPQKRHLPLSVQAWPPSDRMRFMFGLVAILTSYAYGQPEIITEDVKLENRSLGINAEAYDIKKADPR